MARYRGSVCRFCRREGVKLFLKGVRCLSTKCAIDRRSYPPGQHGQSRAKISDYGLQLREKQKVKRIFGVLEKQFRNAFERASRKKGVTGESLLSGLELRLDSVVYRMGLGTSRNEARMLVTHGHLEVNGRKVNIPSFQCKVSDVISLRTKSRSNERFKENLRDAETRGVIPSWLDVQKEQFSAVVREQPKREEINILISENLIVELYSR
ncbi:30S ribosomal protein S4 [Leptospirillum ferriphilum]|uniref:Small ribosomal subunit protein uS4 n=3 Tax=Leptospirillum TaxID=179 RepID=A0A059XUF1_9BACT|nr:MULTISPECIES: 30S ribosomal protein S4 [Leptospirillum]AIA30700.1 30S ribosomal protein S4 [Leptospirillum ferriphilum YSK]EAY55930.1 MAG: ribosomal protein S4 [Leptospirillum rubarum]EDZ39183.1 MAG: Ribosomal protein S4 [Leptospirillum sp. Group II '5-way CG']EIJ76320.1 MAG: Ribosomal protein S4 [Leptospirillum sp. Group II 'C75']